jgi:DNA-directed RNA polymerase specialized sigma subunit
MPSGEAARQRQLAALRRDLLAELKHLRIKADEVHRALDDAAAAYLVVRDHIRKKGMASEFVGLLDPASLRSRLSDSLSDLEHERHLTQRVLFRLLVAEGMSMSDIARGWGISRQLVSRIVNEPD